MGGPGSGRRPRVQEKAMQVAGLSRVELEHVLARDLEIGTPEALDNAAAIRAELAARTWQNINPYADAE